MIDSLRVSHYKSLGEDVEVRFGQITALVGPNGSGKSNVLDVLRFLRDCMRIGLEGAITGRHGIDAVRSWSSGRPFNLTIEIRLRTHDGHGSYTFTLTGDRQEDYRVRSESAKLFAGSESVAFRVEDSQWVEGPSGLRPQVDAQSLVLPLIAGDRRFQVLAESMRDLAIYAIFPDTLREPQKYDPARPMQEHGSNWVSILKDRDQQLWKNDLLAGLTQLTGDIDDIRLEPAGGYLLAQFRHGKDGARAKWFDASQESDGTLRAAGIITALLQDPPVPFIGIEEPELTVHPGVLPLLYDYVRQAAARAQVAFTTHSPDLLDLMDPDDVRVVERIDGATRVSEMKSSQKAAVKRGLLSLGEVLRIEGMQGELFASEG